MSQAITKTGSISHKELYNILNSLLTDIAAVRTVVNANKTVIDDAKTLVNDLRNKLLGDFVDGATGLAIGSDAPKVAHGAFSYHINGQQYSVDADATGTVLEGETVPDAKAGAWALEIDAAGTISIVEAPANAAGYASAALAVAALPAQTADKARLGTVSILNNGATFVPGTTDLSAVTVTDAYVDATPLLTTIGAAVSSSTSSVAALNTISD